MTDRLDDKMSGHGHVRVPPLSADELKALGATTNAVTLCANCHTRPGDKTWVGEGGTLAWVHGMYALWCERCVLEAQLEYARKSAARIPEIEQRLQTLKLQG